MKDGQKRGRIFRDYYNSICLSSYMSFPTPIQLLCQNHYVYHFNVYFCLLLHTHMHSCTHDFLRNIVQSCEILNKCSFLQFLCCCFLTQHSVRHAHVDAYRSSLFILTPVKKPMASIFALLESWDLHPFAITGVLDE